METAILLMFVSSVLASVAVLSFVWTVRSATHEHADRLALRPLDDDQGRTDP